MKHLTALERAGLVRSQKVGRRRRLYFDAVPIRLICERLTDEYGALRSSHVTAFEDRVERRADD